MEGSPAGFVDHEPRFMSDNLGCVAWMSDNLICRSRNAIYERQLGLCCMGELQPGL